MTWVDVRVAEWDQDRAVEVLTFAYPGELHLDEDPPRRGPEVQLSVCHEDEEEVVATLVAEGIEVLASRIREAERSPNDE